MALGMKSSERKPFIPRDQPKFWVLFIVSCLCALGAGLLVIAAASLGLHTVSRLVTVLLMFFSVAAAIFWLGFSVNTIRGRYLNLRERPWTEQQW